MPPDGGTWFVGTVLARFREASWEATWDSGIVGGTYGFLGTS